MARVLSSRPPQDATDDDYRFIEEVNGRLNFEAHIVLVVDDEAPIRRLICREIKRAAPTVLTVEAGNGERALEKLADIRENFRVEPLFIVLDLKMPGMDGWDLIDALRKDYEAAGHAQGIPIIVLSSTTGEKRSGLRKQSIHGGRADYAPLVSVAKENCVQPRAYDALGRVGLAAWMKHFLHRH